eukprot:scpid41597/ scgid18705/ 
MSVVSEQWRRSKQYELEDPKWQHETAWNALDHAFAILQLVSENVVAAPRCSPSPSSTASASAVETSYRLQEMLSSIGDTSMQCTEPESSLARLSFLQVAEPTHLPVLTDNDKSPSQPQQAQGTGSAQDSTDPLTESTSQSKSVDSPAVGVAMAAAFGDSTKPAVLTEPSVEHA